MFFMGIYNSCKLNGNNLCLLIKTDKCSNGHNVFTKFNEYKGGLKQDTNDNDGQMLVVFIFTEINYVVVSLFYDLVWPLSYLYLWH